MTTLPSTRDSPSTSPSMRRSSVSRISRFASSMSSSLPVSFHQPSTMCGRTSRPRSIRSWMASVISSSFRKLGRIRFTDVEDLRAEHVDADQGEVALRLLRLLDQPHHAAVAQLGDAEHLRVGHARQQDLRGRLRRPANCSTKRPDALVEQVVAEVHHERLVADERLADEHGVRQAARRVLLDVGDLERPTASRRRPPPDLGGRVADDDADLADPGVRHRLDAVEEHRLVGHRHELLGARVGERPQARALARR